MVGEILRRIQLDPFLPWLKPYTTNPLLAWIPHSDLQGPLRPAASSLSDLSLDRAPCSTWRSRQLPGLFLLPEIHKTMPCQGLCTCCSTCQFLSGLASVSHPQLFCFTVVLTVILKKQNKTKTKQTKPKQKTIWKVYTHTHTHLSPAGSLLKRLQHARLVLAKGLNTGLLNCDMGVPRSNLTTALHAQPKLILIYIYVYLCVVCCLQSFGHKPLMDLFYLRFIYLKGRVIERKRQK